MKYEKMLILSDTIHKPVTDEILNVFLKSNISDQLKSSLSNSDESVLYYNDTYDDIKVYVLDKDHIVLNELYVKKDSITLM